MKSVPFLTSTVLAFLCLVLSLVSFFGGEGNNSRQQELLQKQTAIQELSEKVQPLSQEFTRQNDIINTGNQLDRQLFGPILTRMGYLAAKNKNDKLRMVLMRQKLDKFLPTDEQLKKMDEAQKAAGGTTAAPAPASTPAPAVRPSTPGPVTPP